MENTETIDEFVSFIREKMYPHENLDIDNGLVVLGLTLQEVILKTISMIDKASLEIKSINELPKLSNSLIPLEKLANIGPVEEEILAKFNMALLKVPMIMEEFLVEEKEIEEALKVRKASLNTIVKINRRLSVIDTPDYITSHVKESEETIEHLEKSLSPFSKIENQIFWKGTEEQLEKLSRKLHDNSTTSSEHEFANVFYKQSKCGIRLGDRGFFVLLIYKLAKNPDPLQPKYIIAKSAVIEVAERFFYDKSKKNFRQFSFRKYKSSLKKDQAMLQRTNALVENFIKGIL